MEPRPVPLETDAAYGCPYCGEQNYTGIDPSAGTRQRLVEDCPVCCRPIVLTTVNQAGSTLELTAP